MARNWVYAGYIGNWMLLGMVGGINGGMVIPMMGGGSNGIGGIVMSMMKEDIGKVMMPNMDRLMVDMQMIGWRIWIMGSGTVHMKMMGGGMPWINNGMPLMVGDMSMMLNGFGAIPQMSRGDEMSLISGTGSSKGKY